MTTRRIAWILSVLSLGLGLAFVFLRSQGRLPVYDFKIGLIFASLAWILFTVVAIIRPKKLPPSLKKNTRHKPIDEIFVDSDIISRSKEET